MYSNGKFKNNSTCGFDTVSRNEKNINLKDDTFFSSFKLENYLNKS